MINTTTKALDTINSLNSELGMVDSQIANVQWQLKSFYSQLDENSLLAIPSDFSPDTARKELDTLLRERLAIASKLQDAEAAYEKAQADELAKLRTDLTRRYKATVKTMLSTAIGFSKALAETEAIREEARAALGGSVAFLPHIGPMAPMWDLTRWDCWPAFWAREAVAAGYVSKDDRLLVDAGIKL